MSYIKLDRALKDWRFKTKPNYVALWVEILLSANYKDKQWLDVDVKRGEFITSRDHLAAATGLSVQTVRTILSKLNNEEIIVKSTNKYTLIKVVKWEEYQSNDDISNQQLTNNQPTTNQQLTTTNKYKNIKNIKISCSYEIELARFSEVGGDVSKIREIAESLPVTELNGKIVHEIQEVLENDEIIKKQEYIYKKFKNKGWLLNDN